MRTKKIVSGLFVILIAIIALLASLPGNIGETPETEPSIEPEPPPSIDELIMPGDRTDGEIWLRVLFGEEIATLPMERYLIGVVAAEMPASFEPEALKAQAVAARTNALYNMYVKPKPRHPDAHVCADFACCTAYSSSERLIEIWGADYVKNALRIISAITETSGEYISYEGEPILAVFHSSSAGKTETSGNVWVSDLPYLQSVDSPETAEHVPDFVSTVNVPRDVFVETVLEGFPDAAFEGGEGFWVTDVTYTESGRVDELTVGGVAIRGTALRAMFKLRSTYVSFEWSGDEIVFTATGYGHGVGMSQYGANVMAAGGNNYEEILGAYYPGAALSYIPIPAA